MTFEETPLTGAYIVHHEPKEDDRGFFARIWCETELGARGLDARLSQASISYNRCRGTLRGMHYCVAPHSETKLVRCTRGAIYDVIVDLRPSSASHLHWFAEVLTYDNRKSLYVPEGFAHGYQTLQDDTEVLYMISKPHNPEAERGLRWDDPALGITWPNIESRILSPRDQNWPPFDPGHNDISRRTGRSLFTVPSDARAEESP